MKNINLNNITKLSLLSALLALVGCETASTRDDEFSGTEKNSDHSSRILNDNQVKPLTENAIPNVKIKPDSTWEDVNLDDFPDRLKNQIESDTQSAKRK